MKHQNIKIALVDAFEGLSLLREETIDLIVCDGPYGVGAKTWDHFAKGLTIQEFNLELIKIFSKILKDGGSVFMFGKHDALDCVNYKPYLKIVSRIIWYIPNRLAQGRRKFTNNYDLIIHFCKNEVKTFNLNDVRVPQMVDLRHQNRCERVPSVVNGKFGKTQFHAMGKNPGDVWGDIKSLTYKSKELLSKKLHTIQKPVTLIERIVKSCSNSGDIILDPFFGTGTTAFVAQKHNRRFIGFDNDPEMLKITQERLTNDQQQNFFSKDFKKNTDAFNPSTEFIDAN